MACVQTNLINYSNLEGGRLGSQELKCQGLDSPYTPAILGEEGGLGF